jgi:2-hydroxy-3-oxopropionate reductase
MRIGFLGTGLMGRPMAHRLLLAGHEVTVWNRSPDKAESLLEAGARVAASPEEAVTGAETVILSLLDGKVVAEVLFESGAAAALEPGRLVIDTSTILPSSARTHARRLLEMGHAPLDAPVSGGTRGAESGTLTLMVGGDSEHFSRALPALRPLGEPTYVGEAGAGQVAKAANQLIVAVTIGAVAEALTLVQRSGVDPSAVRSALLGGFADSRILREHGQRMLDRDFTPGGRVAGQLKDLRIIAAVAEDCDLQLPLTARVTDLFRRLSFTEPDLDHSALLLELEDLNKGSSSSPTRVGE